MALQGVGKQPVAKRTRVSPSHDDIHAYEAVVQVLIALSTTKATVTATEILQSIVKAPDPETARKGIETALDASCEALDKKWNQTIEAIWVKSHPHIPLLPHIPLTSEDVDSTPVMRDTLCFLQELESAPADMVIEQDEMMLSSEEALRLALSLPSWQGVPLMAVEHESALPTVHRLRVLLQTLGIIRIYQHHLRVVQSKYQAFRQLPKVQQFYLLWHTEAYHVPWGDFAGLWSRHLEIFQGYLPLLWDLHSDIEAGSPENVQEWTEAMVEAFYPIWEQEGLKSGTSHGVLTLYQQAALPTIIEKLVLRTFLVRYGLIQAQATELNMLLGNHDDALQTDYHWTRVGEVMMKAEHENDLPCAIDLLKEIHHR